jgi:VWFA-related protein
MRRLLVLLLLALPLSAQLQEKISVERVIVDARVTDSMGEPILNLGVNDFRVRIDGKPAKVESVLWVPETAVQRDLADIDRPQVEVNKGTDIPAPQGRLFVFFYQTDFARVPSRVTGQMKLLQNDDYLDFLEPEDRVAVLSYDSHLKFRLDFTDDKKRIRDAMESAILINDPPPPQAVPMPSLAKRLDPDEMKHKTNTIGDALIMLANALRPIPGPKSIIFFSWGIGQFTPTGVYMDYNYPIARYALDQARTSVFSIDFTQADYHTLWIGLDKVAEDTGGFYASTYHFQKQAVERLRRTLGGHYELEVRKADTGVHGAHSIEVTTTKKAEYVMARKTFFDAD